MKMSNQRQLRSNPMANDSTRPLSLSDIRTVVEESKKEVLKSIETVREEFEQLRNQLLALDSRINQMEKSVSGVRETLEQHRADICALKSAADNVNCPKLCRVRIRNFRESM